MKYPASFTPAKEGGFVITFRDIPEAITQGDDEAEAQAMALDVLVEAIDCYFEDRRSVPAPSRALPGERLVRLPVSIAAKVLLLNQMIADGVRPADLARLMRIRPQEVNRLIDLRHATKIDTVADALHALGNDLDLRLESAVVAR